MTTSVFLAESNQSHFVLIDNTPNVADNLEDLSIGAGIGKFPGISPRRVSMHSWHLESPVSGTSIPKSAIIDGVIVELVPNISTEASANNSEFGFAFMRPDGHWDRSREHPLHQRQGAASYGPPVHTLAMSFQIFNENSTSIARSIGPAGSGILSSFTTDTEDFNQTFGSTIQIPANEQIGSIGIELGRNDSPGTDPEVRVNLYSLAKNERGQGLDTLIATSDAVLYNSLPTTSSGNEHVFTFSPTIPAEAQDRWMGFMIEGDWFDADNASTHRLLIWSSFLASQENIPKDSFGSLMVASKVPTVQFENSFVGYYPLPFDVPSIWVSTFAATRELNTPISRRVSDIFIFNPGEVEHEELNWTIGRPVSFGSIEYGAQVSLTGDIVDGLQDYIDSDDYDPDVGRVWVGLMLDRREGAFKVWRFAGPGNTTLSAIKLIIDWHPRLINST